MSFVNHVWKDLQARKLWPVALVLLVAIAAVPVVLSSSSSPPPPVSAAPPAPVTNGLPAVNETSAPASGAPNGPSRNPFAPASGARSSVSASSRPATPVAVAGQTGAGGAPVRASSGPGGSPAGTGTASPVTPFTGSHTPPVPSTISVPKPRRPTPALSPEQSYLVSLAITNSRGGLDTRPLERLSPLPSASRPLLVELGVLRGGSRVLFAVQPGTVVSGPGQCIPGPIDCEILSLAQAQTERLSVHAAKGPVEVALFAVAGIRAVGHASRSAALRARKVESPAGRRVLNHSTLSGLNLFHYTPAVGAVVDLRNLTLRDM